MSLIIINIKESKDLYVIIEEIIIIKKKVDEMQIGKLTD